MDDNLQVCSQIERMCQEYDHVSAVHSKPVQFLQHPDENKLNSDISSVFSSASSILRIAITDPMFVPDDFHIKSPEILQLNSTLEDLTTTLAGRVTMFASSFSAARQMMTDRLYDLHNKYHKKIQQIAEENNYEKVLLEDELKDLQDSFDSKLEDEVSPHISERAEIQKKLTELKKNYEETNERLMTSVNAAKTKLIELEEKKDEYSNSSTFDDLTLELSKCEAEIASRISEAKETQKKLNEELTETQNFYVTEEKRLQNELQKFETAESDFQKAIESQLISHNSRKIQIESEGKKKERELRKQIEKEELFNTTSITKMKTEIEEHKKLIAQADERYQNALHELETKTNLQLEEREKEKQNLEKSQIKTLKQMQQKHQENLNSIRKDGEMARFSLEQKLIHKQQQMQQMQQNQKKVVSAIPSSTTVITTPPAPSNLSHKTAPRRVNKINANANVNINNNINDNGLIQNTKNDHNLDDEMTKGKINGQNVGYDSEISERLDKFEFASKMELDSLSKANEAVSNQRSLNHELFKIAIENVRRQLNEAQKQKEIISERLQEANNSRTKSNEAESESKLNSRISIQYTKIAELKNDISKIKGSNGKHQQQQQNQQSSQTHSQNRVDLSVIQEEHKEEVEKMKKRLSVTENANKKKIIQVKEKYGKTIEEEVQNRQRTLAQISQRIEEISEELNKTKELIQEAPIEGHQKWMKMRKEMADSTNRMLDEIQENGAPRQQAASVQRFKVEAKSSLPLLKH